VFRALDPREAGVAFSGWVAGLAKRGRGRGRCHRRRDGAAWKTLDDVKVVLVAAVDDLERPENVEVYMFPAEEVRKPSSESHEARIKAGMSITDGYGMWVSLDNEQSGMPTSVGSGIGEKHGPIAVYSIKYLLANEENEEEGEEAGEVEQFTTVAEFLNWARPCVADIAGVNVGAVKLTLTIEQ